jgi:hypothetical protein
MNDVGASAPSTLLRAGFACAGRFWCACGVIAVCLLTVGSFAANPVPTVTGPVQPQAVAPGSGPLILTVYGAGFVSGAVVNWNGSPRSTTYVSPRELQAQILASDVAKPTAGYITVTNPAPGGGISSSSYDLVEVHKPTKTIVPRQPRYNGSFQQGPIWSLVAADFNGDGKLDIAEGDGASELIVELGNGDGTFHRGSVVSKSYFPGGASGVAFGDFNNDGKLDLVFSQGSEKNYPPTYAAVKLGNGRGGFKFGSLFGDFHYITQFAVGDFNGDGKLDVAVGDTDGKVVSIFLGNGDGTFTPAGDYGSLITVELVAADFNGDGKLDLAIDASGAIWILIGNGDGTFQTPVQVASISGFCAFGPQMFAVYLQKLGIVGPSSTVGTQLLHVDLVDVAPAPVFTRLK